MMMEASPHHHVETENKYVREVNTEKARTYNKEHEAIMFNNMFLMDFFFNINLFLHLRSVL